MMFCPNDKALMRPIDGVMACPKCGHKKGTEQESVVVSAKAKDKETVLVDNTEKMDLLPTATYFCEKCGHDTAYYYFRQTRAADEATTRFLECVKCSHKWREYR